EPRDVPGLEEAEREPFLTAGTPPEPVIGDCAQLVHHTCALPGRQDPERCLLSLETMERGTIFFPMTSFQGERGQIDPRLLAKFDKCPPPVSAPIQVLARHLVKHRTATAA